MQIDICDLVRGMLFWNQLDWSLELGVLEHLRVQVQVKPGETLSGGVQPEVF